jgi:hypothetical protein
MVWPSRSGWPLELDLLGLIVVVGDYWRIVLLPLQKRRPPLPQVVLLSLVQLRRISSTFLALLVLAVEALLVQTEGLVADVAVPPNPHAYRLLYAKCEPLGAGMPVALLDVKAISLRQLLRTFLV